LKHHTRVLVLPTAQIAYKTPAQRQEPLPHTQLLPIGEQPVYALDLTISNQFAD